MFKYLSDDLRISFRNQYLLQYVGCYIIFYTPVFRRDVLCYGDVRPSGSPSLRQSQFPHFSPVCHDILSWNLVYDFILMHVKSSSTVVASHQFLKELCLLLNSEYRKYTFFSLFLTHFDILSWNFAFDFVLLYYWSSSSVVTLRQFLKELCPFWT